MAMKTPMGRVLGLGSAKEGTEHWWMQRMTALALIPLTIWFVGALLALGSLQHALVTDWIGRPLNAIGLLLLTLALVYHSLLGTQVVIEDYVKGGVKIATLIVTRFIHVIVAVAAVFAILKIAFGSGS